MDTEERALAYVGTVVADKYRVLALLGAGGMGTVYLAEHVFTRRRVALKRMHPEYARSSLAAERFIRESQAPSTIGHPGIVQVLDGGSHSDGSLYLVLELLEGVSMREALELDTLTASSVTQLGIELLHALAAAHAKGFIHRDIKPDNVFIARDGSGAVAVKLLDFGVASLRDEDERSQLTQTGAVLGTAQYMSPEQAVGARVDQRSDLWSVGALLYRALTGRLPYPGESYGAVIAALASRHHIPLDVHRPDLPPALVQAVERALRKRPEERFESALEMGEALAAVSFEDAPQIASSVPPRADPAAVRTAVTRAASANQQLAAAARAVRTPATAVVHPAQRASSAQPGVSAQPPRTSTPARAPMPAGVLRALLTGTLLLCTLTWVMLRAPGVETRAAVAQLTASQELRSAGPGAAGAPQAAPAPPAAGAPAQPTLEELTPTAAPAEPSPAAAAPEGQSQAALVPVLAGLQPGLERCLQDCVVSQLLAGAQRVDAYRLDVELRVAASGRVDAVELAGPAPAQLLACLRGQLLAAAFPRAAAPTTFRYPLVLTPTVVGQ